MTSVLALPSGDVISGQSALVNVVAPPDDPQIGNIVEATARADRRQSRRSRCTCRFRIVRARSANAYPESLMGVIAFVRQAFLDAQHYGVDAAATDDPALDAMQPAVDRKLPVAFEANEARQILRALKMAKELKLDPIVTGARDAEEVAADLKSQNVRVIYSLNYPTRPRALAPDADEPISALRDRADAPKVPGALAKAGVAVRVCLVGARPIPKDFVKNAGKAVKAGLTEDAAHPGADDQRRDDRRRRRPPRIDRERQGREPRRDRRQSLRREDEDHTRVRRWTAGRPGGSRSPGRTGPGAGP